MYTDLGKMTESDLISEASSIVDSNNFDIPDRLRCIVFELYYRHQVRPSAKVLKVVPSTPEPEEPSPA